VTPIEKFHALPPDAQARAIARLPESDQRKLFDGLRKLQEHAERTKFYRMFPDKGPHRRELYPKHCDVIAKSQQDRFIAFLGGNGTGKTELGAYIATAHAIGDYPDWWDGWRVDRATDIWVAGDTKETVRDIIQGKLIGEPGRVGTGMLPASRITKVTMRQNSNGSCDFVHVKHNSGRISRIGFKSYDQRRESFQGTEKDFIWLDEECPPDIYQECIQRFRGKSAEGRLLLTFTPLSGITQVVSMFVPSFATDFNPSEYKASSRAFVMCGWDEVPHLSETEKLQKIANTLPHEREARTMGTPSIGSGKVYQVPESDFIIDPLPTIPKHWPRIYGADFGFSNDTAVVFMAHDLDADCVYLYAEYSRPQAEPEIHAGAIKAMGGGWIPGVGDYAGANLEGEKTLDIYKRLGLNIHAANKEVNAGILDVMTRLSQGRLKVYNTCSKWLQEYRLYSRDENGKVIKNNDHLMDATRYAIRGLKRASIKPVQRTIPRGAGSVNFGFYQ
jgi:phage terminase large subunit-like protein